MKKILTVRVWVLIIFLVLSFIVIQPKFNVKGVSIAAVEKDSAAYNAGILPPSKTLMDTQRELILKVNNQEVNSPEEFSKAFESLDLSEYITITTNKGTYTILRNNSNIGLSVGKAATSNIKKGLELQGGTRVLLEPEEEITDEERADLVKTMEQRLNIYGLSDVKLKAVNNLLGDKFILVEVAGVTKEEVRDLIAKQGKFEAKIGDKVVFIGGKKDITFVCRNDGRCAGIKTCNQVSDDYACNFAFQIKLSTDAANKQAAVTEDLEINITGGYLSKKLDLYLDDNLVDSLSISKDLKGRPVQDIEISGYGFSADREIAFNDAAKNMDNLQTILITGSLPVKLNIVKMDSISPILGEAFVKNAFLVGLFSIFAVGVVIFIRYRKIKIALPMVLIGLSEVVIILGISSFIKYNLDLAAIAGIIAAVGTGMDDQIVIADEVLKGESKYVNWKEKIKRAFFIILAAYFTTVAAMLPLLRAGAGLLTGFAIITIIGVSIGVFITRPAFASIVRSLFE